ncbi:MAG: hypothetical protein ABSF51_11625 [Verrucomicrobiota bacterium]
MKILAGIADCGWLLFIIVMVCKNFGTTLADTTGILVLAIVLATLILNLIALFWRGKTHDWISLFLQRKALEEKKKMEMLNTGNQGKRP